MRTLKIHDGDKQAIESIITKIASDYAVTDVTSVDINLTQDESLVRFNKVAIVGTVLAGAAIANVLYQLLKSPSLESLIDQYVNALIAGHSDNITKLNKETYKELLLTIVRDKMQDTLNKAQQAQKQQQMSEQIKQQVAPQQVAPQGTQPVSAGEGKVWKKEAALGDILGKIKDMGANVVQSLKDNPIDKVFPPATSQDLADKIVALAVKDFGFPPQYAPQMKEAISNATSQGFNEAKQQLEATVAQPAQQKGITTPAGTEEEAPAEDTKKTLSERAQEMKENSQAELQRRNTEHALGVPRGVSTQRDGINDWIANKMPADQREALLNNPAYANWAQEIRALMPQQEQATQPAQPAQPQGEQPLVEGVVGGATACLRINNEMFKIAKESPYYSALTRLLQRESIVPDIEVRLKKQGEHIALEISDMIRTAAGRSKRWNNYCNRLMERIMRGGDDFPEKKEIDRLLRYTEMVFQGSPFIEYAKDRAFNIKVKWDDILGKMQAEQNKEKVEQFEKEQTAPAETEETPETVEKKIQLAASVNEVIADIARTNKIAMADQVIIQLSDNDGTIFFKGAE